jgi:ferredoxin
MARYKVVFDRGKCIGALNCVGAAPDFWKMAKDGKVDLANAKESKKQVFELMIDAKDFEQNQTAAQVCPAKAIKVEKI